MAAVHRAQRRSLPAQGGVSALSRPMSARRRGLPPVFVGAGLSFLGASAGIALGQATERFAHGWWLVSFLALVGGLAQLLLGAGHRAVAAQTPGIPTSCSPERQAALWNAGALLVPLGVLAEARLAVVVGSVLLLGALAGSTVQLRRAPAVRVGPMPPWQVAYAVLLASLAASVFLGTWLAWDVPWT
jgi:hypothetical protein